MANAQCQVPNDQRAGVLRIGLLWVFGLGHWAFVHADTITLYTSVDQPIAKAVVSAFEKESGHSVKLVTDTEASKSVGLAEKLRAEKDRPRADVWWGNEPFYTIALADDGLLEPLDESAVASIDPHYVDRERRFAGAGLRVRVFAAREGVQVRILEDLLQPDLKDQVVLARPTAGTTGGHVAAIYVKGGQSAADTFFRKLHANGAVMVGGNSVAAQQVANGNFKVCLTDNDDVAAVNASDPKHRLMMIVPDQIGNPPVGTLVLPTTVALVKKPGRAEASRELVAFLLSEKTEQVLLDQQFIAASTRKDAADSLKVTAMDIDYAEVAKQMPEAIRRATALLEGREP
jgi:iron(III) transport system substrate-binding protein